MDTTHVFCLRFLCLVVTFTAALCSVVAQEAVLRVDSERLLGSLKRLAEFGRTVEGGVTRVAFSPADVEARSYVQGLLREAGLSVTVDAAGNIVARREGTAELPPIMIGSHIDSVPMGGNYDGQVGAMAAVEVARVLVGAKTELRHPLEVVVFSNEENGKTGSRAMAGEVESRELVLTTHAGVTIGEGMRVIGGDPARLSGVRRVRGDVAVFLELHIEQGAVLEAAEIPIGIVEGIVGIRRWNVSFSGFANHAGTTPMTQRRDALVAAASFVVAVHETAKRMEGRQVATVGQIEAVPGAANVIPGRVELSLEIRDLSMGKIDDVFAVLREEGQKIATDTRTSFAAEPYYISYAAPTDERVRRLIERGADALGFAHRRMPSGAGHDAQSIAQFAPIGMIFVPSVAGISHSPREHSTPEDILAGANLLLRSVLLADRDDW